MPWHDTLKPEKYEGVREMTCACGALLQIRWRPGWISIRCRPCQEERRKAQKHQDYLRAKARGYKMPRR